MHSLISYDEWENQRYMTISIFRSLVFHENVQKLRYQENRAITEIVKNTLMNILAAHVINAKFLIWEKLLREIKMKLSELEEIKKRNWHVIILFVGNTTRVVQRLLLGQSIGPRPPGRIGFPKKNFFSAHVNLYAHIIFLRVHNFSLRQNSNT